MSRCSTARTIVLLLTLSAFGVGCDEDRPTTAHPSTEASWGAESDRIFYNARPRRRPVTASTFTYPPSAYETVPRGYYAEEPIYDAQLPDSGGLPPQTGPVVTQPEFTPPPVAPTTERVTVDDSEQASKLRLARLKMRAAYENFKDAMRPAADYLRTETKRVYYESKYALNRAIEAFRRVRESEEVLEQVEDGKSPDVKPPIRPKGKP